MTYQCPKCGSKLLRVECTVVMTLLPTGVVPLAGSEPEWDDNSFTLCNQCEYQGEAWEFETDD